MPRDREDDRLDSQEDEEEEHDSSQSDSNNPEGFTTNNVLGCPFFGERSDSNANSVATPFNLMNIFRAERSDSNASSVSYQIPMRVLCQIPMAMREMMIRRQIQQVTLNSQRVSGGFRFHLSIVLSFIYIYNASFLSDLDCQDRMLIRIQYDSASWSKFAIDDLPGILPIVCSSHATGCLLFLFLTPAIGRITILLCMPAIARKTSTRTTAMTTTRLNYDDDDNNNAPGPKVSTQAEGERRAEEERRGGRETCARGDRRTRREIEEESKTRAPKTSQCKVRYSA